MPDVSEKRRFALCVGARALLAVATLPATQETAPTFLGVVGADGMLTPIAVFDGRDWWDRWPWDTEEDGDEIKALPLPPSLAAIPADWLPEGVRFPTDWRVLRPSGKSVRIRAINPTRRPGFQMMETIVIRTTFPKQSDPDVEALAIAGPGRLGRFVSPPPDEQERILAQLRPRIAQMERDEIARWRSESSSSADVTLTEVFRVETPKGAEYLRTRPAGWRYFDLRKAEVIVGGRTYYYLDGEKLFTMRSGDDCMMNLSIEGPVAGDRDGRVLAQHLSSAAFENYCGDRAEWMQPLAAVSVGGRTVWIGKDSTEDGYNYLLVDPEGGSVTLKGTWALRKSSGFMK